MQTAENQKQVKEPKFNVRVEEEGRTTRAIAEVAYRYDHGIFIEKKEIAAFRTIVQGGIVKIRVL